MTARPPQQRVFPVAVNHRGRELGVWLGAACTAAIEAWLVLTLAFGWVGVQEVPGWRGRVLVLLVAAAAVCAAGLYDDFRPARARGVIRQLTAAARGRITPGVVKLVAIAGASAFVAWGLGLRGGRLALAVPVVAGAANLWNLFDVAPGRAIKLFLPAAMALAVVGSAPADVRALLSAATGAALAVFVLDLREWAMLGDAGSNVLGFVVGIGAGSTLSTSWLVVALIVVLALHVLSETVTLSRLIRAAPPLRWFDDLGRVPPDAPQPST